MVFEDVHWLDPSSRDLLDQAIERIATWPALLVATFRPEFQPPWTGNPNVTTLALTRLDRRETASLVDGIAGGDKLPAEIVDEIVDRTDGVPLFVEEFTKAVIEALASGGTATLLAAAPRAGAAVPATLQASLMARLDHLGPAKEVAQVGAAIGRTFDYELLAAVLRWKEVELQAALRRLAEAGLLFARGIAPQSTYLFKHALVQDAAYGSLLRSRRQVLHRQIAEVLESRTDVEPELLAHHFTEAGFSARAVDYWLKAGQQAMARSAMVESVALARKGLNLVPTLPDAQSQQLELDLQLALGRALVASQGYTVSTVGDTYARARELCERLNQTDLLLAVLFGQYVYCAVRGELRPSLEVADQCLIAGRTRGDRRFEYLGHRCHLTSAFAMGEFATAREHATQVLNRYDPSYRNQLADLTAEDPHIATLTYDSWLFLCLGYVDQAHTGFRKAIAEARATKQLHVLAYAVSIAGTSDVVLHDLDVAREHVAEALKLSSQHEFGFWEAWATLLRGSLISRSGRSGEGIELIKKGETILDAIGMGFHRPLRLMLLAEAYALTGSLSESLRLITEAIEFTAITEERWSEAELHRVRGELLRKTSGEHAAEESFQQALAVAQCQSAKLWELRTAVSLARLWRDQGKRGEARNLLAPVYAWFTEGFDTPDLQDARELLRELA